MKPIVIGSWMGDDRLPLPDVNTENVEVIQGLQKWITEFVTGFGVDGLRIDGASGTGFLSISSNVDGKPGFHSCETCTTRVLAAFLCGRWGVLHRRSLWR